MVPLIISIFFQIINLDLCYEIGLLRIVCLGSFLKFLHSQIVRQNTKINVKVEISNPLFLLLFLACKESSVCDSLGLVDFAIGLVIFVLRQVLYFGGNSNYRRTVVNPANQKGFWG